MREETFANRTSNAVTTFLNATEELINVANEYEKAGMAVAVDQNILNDVFGVRNVDDVATPNVLLSDFQAIFYAIGQLDPDLTGAHISTLLKMKR